MEDKKVITEINKETFKYMMEKAVDLLIVSTKEIQTALTFQELAKERKQDPAFKMDKAFIRKNLQQVADWLCEVIQEETQEAMGFADKASDIWDKSRKEGKTIDDVITELLLDKVKDTFKGTISAPQHEESDYDRTKRDLLKAMNIDLNFEDNKT